MSRILILLGLFLSALPANAAYNSGKGGVITTTTTVRAQFSVGSGATISTVSANGSITLDANATLTVSSAAFIGVYVSTQAAGGAGAAVTATCRVGGTFAIGGGCDCAGAIAETANLGRPNQVVAGGIATGWVCQVAGGTGGVCSSYVICSKAQ